MDPKLKINRDTRISQPHQSYTRKQIMEEYHPELWKKAGAVASKLLNLQEKVIKLLPEAKRLLPSNVEALKDEEAQANFLSYIKLRALYVFSKKICGIIETRCRQLAEAENRNDRDDIEDAKIVLDKILRVVEMMPFDEFNNDPKFGLLKLDEFKKQLEPDNIDSEVLIPFGMFTDIVEEYKSGKLMSEYWLRLAIDDKYPTNPNCGPLLDDDKMIRIY